MSPRLLFLALALPLAACGGDEAADTTVVDTTDPMVDDAMSDDMTAVDPMASDSMSDGAMASDVTVDGTIAAAGSDLTALAPAAAIANIDGWLAKLDGAQFGQAGEIRNGLEELKAELSASPLDGAEIGETLADLGQQTTATAAEASSSSQAGLRALGSALSAAGAKLGGTSATL